jgi:hypothetical protein
MLLVCHRGPASSAGASGQPNFDAVADAEFGGVRQIVANCGRIWAKMCECPCAATFLPLFRIGTVSTRCTQPTLFKGTTTMRKIILAAAAGAAALTLSACSEKTEDAAATTADSAAADTAANADAMGEAVDNAADNTAAVAADAADTTAAAATDAAAAAEANVQGESTEEAKAD